VVVGALDERHLGPRPLQRLGGKQPAEAAADDRDPMEAIGRTRLVKTRAHRTHI
jgi:hypothetical protein